MVNKVGVGGSQKDQKCWDQDDCITDEWWLWSSHSVVSDSCEPVDCIARQAPLPMGFSRQEYWSRLPFPSPTDE